MSLYLITGGARSGKSCYAEALAQTLGGDDVLYIATLEAKDEEMRRRAARHRRQRPAVWRTAEVPLEVAAIITKSLEEVVLLDCLSGFVSNLLLRFEDLGEEGALEAVLKAVDNLTNTLNTSHRQIVVVTNEVGQGVVPAYPLGRWYRDALGLSNQRVAQAADAVCVMTVGLPQVLKGTFPEVPL